MKKQWICSLFILLISCMHLNAQKDLNFDENIRKLIEGSQNNQDTVISNRQDTTATNENIESNNETILQQKKEYTQSRPSQRLRKQEPLQMSNEALYWSRYATNAYNRFGPYTTYRDTIIINPLFMPPLFKKGHVMPVDSISFYEPSSLTEEVPQMIEYTPVRILEKQAFRLQLEDRAYRYIQYNKPYIFDYTAESLPSETISYIRYNKKADHYVPVAKIEPSPQDIATPVKFIPDRQYWTSSFESALKFSQNYTSSNWYNGEAKNMNIFTKNLVQYNYAKEKIQLNNLLEINASVNIHDRKYSKDTLRNYTIGDDLLRFYSNFGYKAFNKWFYTLDLEFKTKMLSSYQENSEIKNSGFFSPFTVAVGLGMKYDLIKNYTQKDRSLTLSVNLAPLTYSFMYSVDKNIDLSRHGFPKDELTGIYEHKLSNFGSTVRADMTVKSNWNVTWKSRLYYFTSYDRILGEFENSLDLAVSRFFSTLIYVNLRYDDAVSEKDKNLGQIQLNEILSFGFKYKW